VARVLLTEFRTERPRHLDAHHAFLANTGVRRRFVLTFIDGSHLIGVPRVGTIVDPTAADARFTVRTLSSDYEIPYAVLAYAERIEEVAGLRPSDGQEPVPEPCQGPVRRAKHEKFSILDSPRLLAHDLRDAPGPVAVLFLDLDHFKSLNERLTERIVDEQVLPRIQQVIHDSVAGHGFAYAEGGDEVILLLHNTPLPVAIAFAEDLRSRIRDLRLDVEETSVAVTASAGLAVSDVRAHVNELPGWANLAKRVSKHTGRDRTTATRDGRSFFSVETARCHEEIPTAAL
jgi:diguanylate cyclase (GGDEF)-like protein